MRIVANRIATCSILFSLLHFASRYCFLAPQFGALRSATRGSPPRSIAAFRYSLIAELANPYLKREELRTLVRQKAGREHEIPFLGKRSLTESCLRKWLAAHKTDTGSSRANGLAWVRSVVGDVERPLVALNRFGAGTWGQRNLFLPRFDPAFLPPGPKGASFT